MEVDAAHGVFPGRSPSSGGGRVLLAAETKCDPLRIDLILNLSHDPAHLGTEQVRESSLLTQPILYRSNPLG
jgi:hypothetical protein